MINEISRLATIAKPFESIDTVVRRMAKESREVTYPGLAVILDDTEVLLGIVTDGDIRRTYAENIPFSREISKVMVADPITVACDTPMDMVASEVIKEVTLKGRHSKEWIHHVLFINQDRKLVRIVDFMDLLYNQKNDFKRVAVFGMGYVGLTLAVSLANRGHQVVGVDVKKDIIDQLYQGETNVYEPGLKDMLVSNLNSDNITFTVDLDAPTHQVYIIAVGTPLDNDLKPDLSSLKSVLKVIANLLKKGDQVMLRSTVPVGTTRGIVIPYLEQFSGLKCGEDFYVSFAPERTVEGRAISELKTLPQVVGGYSSMCVQNCAKFWATLTPATVQVESIEAAELVKLANNTYRDISFAFANELALLSSKYNINSFMLINAANEGYPRNKIPLPSPGVGGYCLTKDPILFSCTPDGPREDAILGISSRKVNRQAALYPIDLIKRLADVLNVEMRTFNVVVMGIAFKGEPETTDIRFSVALDIVRELQDKVKNIVVWDAVVGKQDLERAGCNVVDDLSVSIEKSNVVLILNNHPDNVKSALYSSSSIGRLVFDGWNQLDGTEIEKIPGLQYATMGYMTAGSMLGRES